MEHIEYTLATSLHATQLTEARITFLKDLQGKQSAERINELRSNLMVYFSEVLDDKKFLCWMAKAGDTVVGVGGMAIRQNPGSFKNPSGKMGYIMNMYTSPAYRRMGIGSTIMKLLIQSAKAIGIRFFELHATKEGEPLYRKHGFELHNEPTYRHLIPVTDF
ncbi:MAG: GNAT family N-acetyltransferase [Taibaiella sp.]|nr:GNAT family N-acetyltransferase [Taibaiella sp.]